MDTIATIRQCAAGINAADLLMTTAQLFVEKSDLYKRIRENPENVANPSFAKLIRHMTPAHELGALFQAIMVQLTKIDATYTTRTYDGITSADTEPAALVWTNENSYEKRLAKALLSTKAERENRVEDVAAYKTAVKTWKTIGAVHTAILNAVRQIIADPTTTGKFNRPNGQLGLGGASAGSLSSSSSSSSSSAAEASRIAAARGVLATGRADIAAASGAPLPGRAGRLTLEEASTPFSRGAAAPAVKYEPGTVINITASNMKATISGPMDGNGEYPVMLATGTPSSVAEDDFTVVQQQEGGTRRRRRNRKGKRAGSRRA